MMYLFYYGFAYTMGHSLWHRLCRIVIMQHGLSKYSLPEATFIQARIKLIAIRLIYFCPFL